MEGLGSFPKPSATPIHPDAHPLGSPAQNGFLLYHLSRTSLETERRLTMFVHEVQKMLDLVDIRVRAAFPSLENTACLLIRSLTSEIDGRGEHAVEFFKVSGLICGQGDHDGETFGFEAHVYSNRKTFRFEEVFVYEIPAKKLVTPIRSS